MKKVIIKKYGDSICADPVEQPGSPRIGIGETPFEALVDLLKYNEEFEIDVTEEVEEDIAEEELEMPEDGPLSRETIEEHGHYDDLLEFLDLAHIETEWEVSGGTWRFKGNKIVRYLIDYHSEETEKTHGNNRGLNLIYTEAIEKNYTLREFVELYIGMGYSLGGFEEVFGDAMIAVLRMKYDYESGDYLGREDPDEESISFFDKPIFESK